MRWVKGCLSVALSVGIVSLVGAKASAQQTTTTEVKQFEVVSVDGNKVVVKGEKGAQEVTVTDDFTLTVAGKQVSVRDLRPGMRGTARITTTTTTTPVVVTEVKNGQVMKVVGNSVIVRGENGIQMYSEVMWRSAASRSTATADRSRSPTFARAIDCRPRSSPKGLPGS